MIPPFVAGFTDDEIAATVAAVERILRSGHLILGPETEAFEAAMAKVAGVAYAVAVSSGSAALEVIFRALDVRGRIVLVPTNTNFATAAAALAAGARVQLYDGGLYLNRGDLERRLSDDVAAVVAVHIGGYMSRDLLDVTSVCQTMGIPVIEDCAHAHGSALFDRPAGGFGYGAAFSFYPTKVITTGEGA